MIHCKNDDCRHCLNGNCTAEVTEVSLIGTCDTWKDEEKESNQ